MPEPDGSLKGNPYRYTIEEMLPDIKWRTVDETYAELSGVIAPMVAGYVILPIPYTGAQRALHRMRICRWHRHQGRPRPTVTERRGDHGA